MQSLDQPKLSRKQQRYLDRIKREGMIKCGDEA